MLLINICDHMDITENHHIYVLLSLFLVNFYLVSSDRSFATNNTRMTYWAHNGELPHQGDNWLFLVANYVDTSTKEVHFGEFLCNSWIIKENLKKKLCWFIYLYCMKVYAKCQTFPVNNLKWFIHIAFIK